MFWCIVSPFLLSQTVLVLLTQFFKDNSCAYSRMIPTISAIQVTLNLVILSLVAVWSWYQFKNRHMLTFARKLATLEPTLPILGHILYCLPDLDGKWYFFFLLSSVNLIPVKWLLFVSMLRCYHYYLYQNHKY